MIMSTWQKVVVVVLTVLAMIQQESSHTWCSCQFTVQKISLMLWADIPLRVGAFYYNVVTHRSPCEKLQSGSISYELWVTARKGVHESISYYELFPFNCIRLSHIFVSSSFSVVCKKIQTPVERAKWNIIEQYAPKFGIMPGQICESNTIPVTIPKKAYHYPLTRTLRFLVHIQ